MGGMSAAILLAAGIASFAGVQPQLAAGGGAVYVTFAAGDTISVARSMDAGATFTTPVALPGAGKLALGKRRGPRVAATAQAVVVAAIAGARGGGADGDLVLYRSTDQGRTWSAPIVVNDVPGAAREGMHGLAANASGLVVLAWLDLRQKGTRIYAAVSRDHGATWSPDRLAYISPSGSVCECCHPSVAVADDGRVAIMFRNHVDGRRDMYVVESRDGAAFGAAVKQGRGSWPLEACPMDGGAIALGAGVTDAVWRREAMLYATVTRAPSVTTDAEVELGPGRDPVVARHDQWVDMAWTGSDGIVLRQAGGAPAPLGPGAFASIVALPAHTVVAYEHQGRVTIQRVVR
jgi:BNR repeat-like domain